jgi:hypothetical protein
MKAFRQLSLVFFMIAFVCVPGTSALTVVTNFIGGTAPANARGGGNLVDIVNAAARMWEAAYPEDVVITINYGWAPVGDAGTHTLLDQGGTPNRETSGMILFDNSGAAQFYLDPTPDENEEYRRRTEEYQDLGGGLVNVARLFSSPTGDAAGHIDLLSVALHEIGHALGICAANTSFKREGASGKITISEELPFAGTVIPLATNRAGITSHFDALQVTYGSVMAGISSDERRIPSALDILVNAQISGYSVLNLSSQETSQSGNSLRGTGGRLGVATSARRSSR